jgi:hypothetical protein
VAVVAPAFSPASPSGGPCGQESHHVAVDVIRLASCTSSMFNSLLHLHTAGLHTQHLSDCISAKSSLVANSSWDADLDRIALRPAWLSEMQAWQSGLLAGADGADETAEACRAARIRVLRASLEEGRGQRDALSVGA